MTPSERLLQAIRIRKALNELMTVKEADMHSGIFEHLDDFIRDITIDIESDISLCPEAKNEGKPAATSAGFLCLVAMRAPKPLVSAHPRGTCFSIHGSQ